LFIEARSVIESPWGQAAVPDFAMTQTEGERPPDFANQLRFGGTLARQVSFIPPERYRGPLSNRSSNLAGLVRALTSILIMAPSTS
jgi:hypothetical protein